MPRRYSDYPDCYYVWNKISSLGSFITVLSTMFFIIILWECFVTKRRVIFSFHNSVNLEWTKSRLPVSFHSFSQSIKLFY
jgi:heme/copper-type cytochrome/quinol oxidase subunit 1